MTKKIIDFADKETERIYNQEFSKKFPKEVQKIALRKLLMMDNAADLNDLRVPPANRLKQLKGDRAGQYSIRVNDQYRICFRHENGCFFDVELCDYHG